MTRATRYMSTEERFYARTDFTDTCWLWLGSTNRKGYGQFNVDGRATYVHRWTYEIHVGPIPDGYQIDHLCRVHNCVNPAHLEAVTPATNSHRGLTIAASNAAKTHCPYGHEYDDINTYVNPRGSRVCLTCKRARSRKSSASP